MQRVALQGRRGMIDALAGEDSAAANARGE
jgi:hypothetical protein